VREIVQGLEPQRLWHHFYEISQIPRCSKHEEKVRDYVLALANHNGLAYRIDSTGNMVIRADARAIWIWFVRRKRADSTTLKKTLFA